MKELLRNAMHLDSKSHDVSIYTYYDKKIKMTYEAYNAVERFSGEVWDGYKWNNLFTLMDLKQSPNSSAYILDPLRRKKITDDLINKGIEFIKIILT